jgi:hypothetical protein
VCTTHIVASSRIMTFSKVQNLNAKISFKYYTYLHNTNIWQQTSRLFITNSYLIYFATLIKLIYIFFKLIQIPSQARHSTICNNFILNIKWFLLFLHLLIIFFLVSPWTTYRVSTSIYNSFHVSTKVDSMDPIQDVSQLKQSPCPHAQLSCTCSSL